MGSVSFILETIVISVNLLWNIVPWAI